MNSEWYSKTRKYCSHNRYNLLWVKQPEDVSDKRKPTYFWPCPVTCSLHAALTRLEYKLCDMEVGSDGRGVLFWLVDEFLVSDVESASRGATQQRGQNAFAIAYFQKFTPQVKNTTAHTARIRSTHKSCKSHSATKCHFWNSNKSMNYKITDMHSMAWVVSKSYFREL